jgi:hypothetical protein
MAKIVSNLHNYVILRMIVTTGQTKLAAPRAVEIIQNIILHKELWAQNKSAIRLVYLIIERFSDYNDFRQGRFSRLIPSIIEKSEILEFYNKFKCS